MHSLCSYIIVLHSEWYDYQNINMGQLTRKSFRNISLQHGIRLKHRWWQKTLAILMDPFTISLSWRRLRYEHVVYCTPLAIVLTNFHLQMSLYNTSTSNHGQSTLSVAFKVSIYVEHYGMCGSVGQREKSCQMEETRGCIPTSLYSQMQHSGMNQVGLSRLGQ